MQTRTYGDLFKLIQSLAGVSSFATTETDDIANLINRRYFEAYQTIQMWPRYLVQSEERKLCNFTVEGITDSNTFYNWSGGYYKLGEDSVGRPYYIQAYHNYGNAPIVAYKLNTTTNQWVFVKSVTLTLSNDGVVTISSGVPIVLQVANADGTYTDHDNPANVEQWSITGTGLSGFPIIKEVNLVPYEETYFRSSLTITGKQAKDDISEAIRVHRGKAFLNNSSREYDFYNNEDGVNVLNVSSNEDSSIFVTYKKKFTPFTTSENFTTSTEEVPSEFFHYIAHSAYSDFLRMDGQHDKAQLEQQNAQQYLALELERVDVIMNQTTVNKRFSTYVNRQSR